jgi:signal transduction histidine kinase/CheY-like chemotaxis protein
MREESVKNYKVFVQNFRHLIVVFVAFFLIVWVSFFLVNNISARQKKIAAEKTIKSAELTILSLLREVEIALQVDSLAVQRRIAAGDNKWEITEFLENFIGWFKGANGFIETYGYIHGEYFSSLGLTFGEDYDPGIEPWYAEAVEAGGQRIISLARQDKYSRISVITMSMAVIDGEGTLHGVIAIDSDIEVLSAAIKGLQFSRGGHGVLINRNLQYTIHPDPARVGQRIAEYDSCSVDFIRCLAETEGGEVFSTRFRDENREDWIAYYGLVADGWIIGIVTRMRAYYADLLIMAALLPALALVFFAILGYILIQLNRQRIRSDTENKSKTSFLAKMSHEIRTPMNSILGVMELLMRKDVSGELHEYISIINNAGNGLLSIINDVLDFSKIESGQLQIEDNPYQLSSLLNDVINVMGIRFTDKPVNFFVDVDANIPVKLIGDEVRVRQILINLLNNAVKYTHKGFVRLSVRPGNMDDQKLELHFIVSDSGIGINKVDMARLFHDFYRIKSGYTKFIEGTGLGLSISSNLCTAMGGEISVESEFGKGSVFTARIIQGYESPVPLAKVEDADEKKVLLLEDRPLYREALVSALVCLGISPVCKFNFDDFIRDLEQEWWDYAIVSSKYSSRCTDYLKGKTVPVHFVFMMERGENSIFRNYSSIMMPIYSVNIAHVLNGTCPASSDGNNAYRIHFTAPDAKVLIVDDISTNLRVASELMVPYQMDIHTCQYSREAVELVRKNNYDIVFMDHMMPDMDGIETVAAIRAMGKTAPRFLDMPIIMLTANAMKGQQEMFLETGSSDFLAKPIEMKKLNVILETWIPKSKRIPMGCVPKPEPVIDETPPDIPGLDTRAGLANSGGIVRIYLDILADYCQAVTKNLGMIKDAAENRDFVLYTTLVHGLKGSSRSVGAMNCGDYAAEMEDAGKKEDDWKIQEKTGEFLSLFAAQVNAITEVLHQHHAGQDPQKKTSHFGRNMRKLKRALSGMDIETVNRLLMGFTFTSLEDQVRETVSEIEQHILMFEYDRAMQKIDALL